MMLIHQINNVRPDRQTVLFSATFPRKMEALARKILHKPIEITVGGRGVVCDDVTQIVEVREDETKFIRLLDILGQTFDADPEAKVLIFVDRQESADELLGQLFKRGYPCTTLHGGKDQADRDSTIADFKSGDTNIVVATSVAARGLDVKQLKVVVNFDCPNHMEDYVHRYRVLHLLELIFSAGRTGRAGQKGEAYTFITSEQDKYAGDIIKALTLSNVPIPPALEALAEQFLEKVRDGAANYSSSGFGGKGLEKLDKERDIVKRIQKKTHGGDMSDEDEDESKEREKIEKSFDEKVSMGAQDALETASTALARITQGSRSTQLTGLAKAREIVATFGNRPIGEGGRVLGAEAAFAYEIEINDYPQKARWAATNREAIQQVSEMSGAAITTRGSFFAPGTFVPPGRRKLYLVRIRLIC